MESLIPISFLHWASMAVSLFNMILLLWLGLTVLFNAERHTLGVWLIGGGLLLSGVFFVSHSAIIGYGLANASAELDFWWQLGWVPVIVSPFAWYLAMLWYAGFWDKSPDGPSLLQQQHRIWLAISGTLVICLVSLFAFANPLPTYTQVTLLNVKTPWAIGGFPVLMLFYPTYMVLCILLALNVLRHPAPSGRMMGDLARQKAKPWLIVATVILLLVSLLVGGIIIWIIYNAQQRSLTGIYFSMTRTVVWVDLITASLIALAIIAIGRAVVSYEVFTRRVLPRRGFFRHWRSVVIFAAGYGLVVGWSVTYSVRPIYSLLLTTILMTLFYGLFSWRAYAERDYYMGQLRPFVSSQHLYDHLLTAVKETPPEVDAITPFRALCIDVLGAEKGYLVAVGSLAPLVGAPLVHPNHKPVPLPSLTEITRRFTSPETICLPIDPQTYQGATWAIPLWSERGLIGIFLLGEKVDGGLYTQEEIEIARASGERLIDTQASVEIARRLMTLQRQRLTESRALDWRARRILHDDILPSVHTAMLNLSASANNAEAVNILGDVHQQISSLLRELPPAGAVEVEKAGLLGAIKHTVESEHLNVFETVNWQIAPNLEAYLQTIPSLSADVVFYAAREVIRNAAHHGRGDRRSTPLHLSISAIWQNGLKLCIEDNGVGLENGNSAGGGSGKGLALHSAMMAVVGGVIEVESAPKAYTRVTLFLPGENQSA